MVTNRKFYEFFPKNNLGLVSFRPIRLRKKVTKESRKWKIRLKGFVEMLKTKFLDEMPKLSDADKISGEILLGERIISEKLLSRETMKSSGVKNLKLE